MEGFFMARRLEEWLDLSNMRGRPTPQASEGIHQRLEPDGRASR